MLPFSPARQRQQQCSLASIGRAPPALGRGPCTWLFASPFPSKAAFQGGHQIAAGDLVIAHRIPIAGSGEGEQPVEMRVRRDNVSNLDAQHTTFVETNVIYATARKIS